MENDFERIVYEHSDNLFRLCMHYTKNTADAEDVVQQAFIKLLERSEPFETHEHEKAWLIRVCINLCKDHLKSSWSKKVVHENTVFPSTAEELPDDDTLIILEHVRRLPDKQKTAIYLFYYMDMPVSQIAQTMNANQNTVLSWLRRARKTLAKTIREEF